MDISPNPEGIMELKKQLEAVYDKLKLAEIKAAAATHGAVDAFQVAALMDSHVIFDNTGRLCVVTAQGERRFMPDGTPMPLETAVSKFLEGNPHLKKGDKKNA